MKLPRAVTAAYGGRIRIGKALSQGHGLVAVHFEGYLGIPNDQGTWTDLAECDEGITWVRGVHAAVSPTAQALLVAAALG